MACDFTIEEFNQLIIELEDKKSANRMLYIIADKVLRRRIRNWCYTSPYLDADNDAGDIFNNTFIKLMKTCVTHFFRNNRIPQGEINYDPEGFQSWLITVAQNTKDDYEKKERKRIFREIPIDTNTESSTNQDESTNYRPEIISKIKTEGDYLLIEKHETLSKAFEIVLSCDRSVYMVLSWLALSMFMIDFKATKIVSTHEVIAVFEKKSLFEMWDIILSFSKRISWIKISPNQIKRIEDKLNKKTPDDTLFGDLCLNSFFGKKGGEASLSDWIYRINTMIKDRITNGTFDS